MSVINGKSYSTPRNINLRDGILRFDSTNASNPLGDLTYGLYVDASGNLIYRNLTTSTTLGAAGSGGGAAPSWDSIYNGDKTMAVSSTTFTIDGTHASNNVLTVSDTAAGTGHLIQITNTGSGKDINGTSDTWSVSSAGDAVFNTITFAGDADSASLTMTVGDFALSDGKMAITDADNEATLVVLNNTASTFPLLTLSGSTAFTGNTTSAFSVFTNNVTTGTVLYLPVTGVTTGKGINLIGTTALTTGILLNVESGTTGTSLATTGRMVYVNHTGTTTNSGILSEFASAATDESVILKVTASGALALGTMLALSGSGVTTGFGITLADLDGLTSGIGVHIASSATAITGAGRLLYVNHTGTTSSTGTLVEFATSATDAANATTLLKLTQGANIVGIGLSVVSTTGLTTGSLIRATTSTAGALATNGAISFSATGNFTSTSATNGGFVEIKANDTTAGVVLNLVADALTTGLGVHLSNGSSAMTSGSLLRVTTGGTGTIATNGIVSFTHTGNFTSTSAVDGGFVEVKANDTTSGTVFNLVADALTDGIGVQLSNATSAMTTGSLLRVTTSGVGTVATNGIVSVRHAGIFVSTSNAGVLDVQASALVGAGTVANFKATAASQTASNIVNVEQSGATITAYTGSMLRVVGVYAGASSTGTAIGMTVANDEAGDALKITNNALTLGTATMINLVHGTSVLGAGTSMLRITSTGVDTGTTTGTLLDLASAATTGHIMLITASAASTGGALVINTSGASQTSASAIRVTQSGTTTGFTGSLVSITGSSTTGSGNALGVTGVNTTTGDTVKITNNALVAGTSTALLISHATSVLGAGNSLLRLSSTSVDTGTTTGTLLDLASTATTGIVQMITANSLTSGTALLVTSSGTVASSGQGVVNIVATGLTTGDALKIDLTEGTLTTGKYINCFDDTGGTSVFSVGENGVILFSDFSEVVTEANVITAAESGTVFFLNSATEFASTLPAVQAGLHFTFIITAAPSGANYTVVTNGGADVIQGQAVVNGSAVPAVNEDSINFVSAAAAVGDYVELWCDGTNWYVAGQGVAAGAITFTVT